MKEHMIKEENEFKVDMKEHMIKEENEVFPCPL